MKPMLDDVLCSFDVTLINLLCISVIPFLVINPSFYKRFVDDIISKKKRDQPDLLFENLNNRHPNIKYTIETMPQKFLNTKIFYEDNKIKTKVQRNERELPVHSHRRFQNVITGMLSTLI